MKHQTLFIASILSLLCATSCSKSDQKEEASALNPGDTTDANSYDKKLLAKWIRCYVLSPKLEDGKIHKFYTYTTLKLDTSNKYTVHRYKYFPKEFPSDKGELGFVFAKKNEGSYKIIGDKLHLLDYNKMTSEPLIWKYKITEGELHLFTDRQPNHPVKHIKVEEYPWDITDDNYDDLLELIPTAEL